MCWLLPLALWTVVCVPVRAQDVSLLYSGSYLQKAAGVYSRNLKGLWEEDFLLRLTQDERRRAGNITWGLPLRGDTSLPSISTQLRRSDKFSPADRISEIS